jgi:ribonucleoside-diphosphate reductase subunit M2
MSLEKVDFEPLLRPSWKRLVIFPVQYHDLWELYKKQQTCLWIAEEICFKQDIIDFSTLSADEKNLILKVLAFFAAADGIVMQNVCENFVQEVQVPEARYFWVLQAYFEAVHAETYNLIIDTLVKDQDQKRLLFEAVHSDQTVKHKTEWAAKFAEDKTLSFAERLLAFACVELLFFSGSFAVLFWLKSRAKLPGVTFSNELIARDENLHVEFACLIYKHIVKKLPGGTILKLVLSAVEVEKLFWTDTFNHGNLPGMSNQLMHKHIEFTADYLLQMLGENKFFFTCCPFEFMETISMEGKSNFFEKRVGEYRKAFVNDETRSTFTTDAEF